jgi:hypothetical protein
MDLICLILVIFLTIVTQVEQVGTYAKELMQLLIKKGDYSTSTLMVAFISITIFLLAIYWIFKKSKRLIRVKTFFGGLKEGLFAIGKIKKKWEFLAYTILIWFLYLLSIRIGFYSLFETSSLSWIPSLTILTFGSFAMIATQGGVGAYQLAVQKTLTIYGIAEVIGLAYGWLLWLVQTLMLLVFGPVSMFLLFFFNRKK